MRADGVAQFADLLQDVAGEGDGREYNDGASENLRR